MKAGGCNIEASVGAPNEEAEMRGAADLDTSFTHALQQRIEDPMEFSSSRLYGGSQVLVQSQTCTVAGNSNESQPHAASGKSCAKTLSNVPNRDMQDGDCNIEDPVGAFNGEAEMRGAAGSDTTATYAGQRRIVDLMEFPSSRLNAGTQVLMQSPTSTRTSNLSALEQIARDSSVSNCQTNQLHAPRQQGQDQVLLGNLGSCDQSELLSELPSSAGQDQPHSSNCGTAIMQSANSYFQESSSLRHNLLPSTVVNPLQNELVRMKKEEEAIKVHEDKTKHLASACEIEIQEIHKKYDLLRKEADNALLQKKLEVELHYRKIHANKLLADTLKFNNQKLMMSSMSQEVLLTALQLYPLQFNLPEQRTLVTIAEPTPPPVQVVHQLSELVSLDATRPQSCSTLPNTGNSLTGYHARSSASHLQAPRPITPAPTPDSLMSLYGVMSQQASFWPHGSMSSLHQMGFSPGSSIQFGSTPQNPLQL